MSLTAATGPLSEQPAGVFAGGIERVGPVLYFEPLPHRIRAVVQGETIVDSIRTMLLHETGRLPVYWFREADVRRDLLRRSRSEDTEKGRATHWTLELDGRTIPDAAWSLDEPDGDAAFLAGHLTLEWGAADEWFCEDEQVFGHPRDPYSRIDVYRTTRHVHVSLDGCTLADTRHAKVLYETGLPPRWYIPTGDVRLDLLEPSSHRSRCAYKGSASYWSVRVGGRLVEDLVWTYADPQHDAEPVRDLLCFFNERVDLHVDGVRGERPRTQWSRPESDGAAPRGPTPSRART
jgi:uncharacterized protein (DUF427 family)